MTSTLVLVLAFFDPVAGGIAMYVDPYSLLYETDFIWLGLVLGQSIVFLKVTVLTWAES